jgi:hypothetical protein
VSVEPWHRSRFCWQQTTLAAGLVDVCAHHFHRARLSATDLDEACRLRTAPVARPARLICAHGRPEPQMSPPATLPVCRRHSVHRPEHSTTSTRCVRGDDTVVTSISGSPLAHLRRAKHSHIAAPSRGASSNRTTPILKLQAQRLPMSAPAASAFQPWSQSSNGICSCSQPIYSLP